MNNFAMQTGIQHLFYDFNEDDDRIYKAIESLAKKHGDRVYSAALSYLFGKNFTIKQAGHYWREATASINQTSGPNQSFRATLLNYLRQKTTELTNPLIIESRDLEAIRLAAVTDGLTQLYNQSYFKQQLQQSIDLANQQAGQTFSILFFDLDHFKQFNDRCGHLQGDQVLRQIGKILRQHTGELDLPTRYGGEEFAILLPDCNLENALQLAETIRESIARESFSGQDRLDTCNLTISGGVANYPQHGTNVGELIEAADRYLYEAKGTRNAILPRLEEARVANRHQFNNIVEFKLAGQDRFTPALSSDISHTGLSLKCDCSPAIGTRVELFFRHPFWPRNLETIGQIRYVGHNSEACTYRLGIQFENPQDNFCSMLRPESLDRN